MRASMRERKSEVDGNRGQAAAAPCRCCCSEWHERTLRQRKPECGAVERRKRNGARGWCGRRTKERERKQSVLHGVVVVVVVEERREEEGADVK